MYEIYIHIRNLKNDKHLIFLVVVDSIAHGIIQTRLNISQCINIHLREYENNFSRYLSHTNLFRICKWDSYF